MTSLHLFSYPSAEARAADFLTLHRSGTVAKRVWFPLVGMTLIRLGHHAVILICLSQKRKTSENGFLAKESTVVLSSHVLNWMKN